MIRQTCFLGKYLGDNIVILSKTDPLNCVLIVELTTSLFAAQNCGLDSQIFRDTTDKNTLISL